VEVLSTNDEELCDAWVVAQLQPLVLQIAQKLWLLFFEEVQHLAQCGPGTTGPETTHTNRKQ
jgi:hypothetical protein